MSVSVVDAAPENTSPNTSNEAPSFPGLRRQNGKSGLSIAFRPEFYAAAKALCGPRISWGVAVLLQQLVYLTATRCDLQAYRKESMAGLEDSENAQHGWVRASCRWVADPLFVSKSTVANWFEQLEDVGLVVRKSGQDGDADRWRVHAQKLFDALADVGCIPEWSTVFGCPEDSGEASTRLDDPPSTRLDDPPSTRLDKKELPKEEPLKTLKEEEATGGARSSGRRQPNDIVAFVVAALAQWHVSNDTAVDIVDTLHALGLEARDVKGWVKSRALDFSSRGRPLSRREVVRYLTSAKDLQEWGFIAPLRVIERQSENADLRRNEGAGAVDGGHEQHPFYARISQLQQAGMGYFDAVEQAEAEFDELPEELR
jgi:hypothetical protein